METLNRFFDSSVADEVRQSRGAAHAVIANNVLAHVDDPIDFLAGCRQLVENDGRVIVEVPYVGDLLEQLEYDTIYHEHLSYFSVTALAGLCDRAGLAIVRLDRPRVHGGSLRLYAQPTDAVGNHDEGVRTLVAEEQARGFANRTRYDRFASDVQRHRTALVDLLERLVGDGRTLAGYGAPAKGNTLLNYCGIGPTLLPYTVDRNDMKVGTFTPGMHVPVLPVSTLTERRPDYVLILAWNFSDEIMRQHQAYRSSGGRFIVPIPVPTVV